MAYFILTIVDKQIKSPPRTVKIIHQNPSLTWQNLLAADY